MARRALEGAIAALLPSACAACEAPSGGEAFCGACHAGLTPPEQAPSCVRAVFAYGGPLADAVRKAKFLPDEGRARALASLFAGATCSAWPDLAHGVFGVAFVPLHWRRRFTRGFDLPEVLAGALARALSVPVVPALRAVRLDPPLSWGATARHRAAAVRGRYACRASVAGRTLLLVDDVVTTGSTLAEASRVLLEAGASAVLPLALAATPRQGDEQG